MPRERTGYRENLQDVLEFFNGKRLLTMGDVKEYTGMKDTRALHKRFPFSNGYISAATLALHLAGDCGK